jgi:hypothetical protein
MLDIEHMAHTLQLDSPNSGTVFVRVEREGGSCLQASLLTSDASTR